jgi:hypothetical protein
VVGWCLVSAVASMCSMSCYHGASDGFNCPDGIITRREGTVMSRKASDEKDRDPFKIDVAWERELKHVFRRCCAQGSLAGLP